MTEMAKEVWYITMAFPVPSEAFVSVEIRELIRQGVHVSIKTVRGQRSDHQQVTRQQETGSFSVDHASPTSLFRGLVQVVSHPHLSLRLFAQLTKDLWYRPFILLASFFWSLRCFDLLAQVKEQRPTVVHLYWGHVPSILGWLLLESVPGQKLTTNLSAYDIEMALPISFNVARRCDGVRTWAPANVKALRRRGVAESSVRVIYQGIELDRFAELNEAQQTKVPGRIAVASRLIPEKGVAEAIQIIAEVSREHPEVHLEVFGDGPQRSQLQQQAANLNVGDRVTFLGHVDQRTLAFGLASAEVFLLHSTHSAERLPNVVKEAAAAGCYCLTTPTPGIELLVRDGESGRILPAENVQAWVDAVTVLLKDPESTRRMAEKAKRRVVEHFDVASTASELIAWWKRLLAQATPAKRVST